MINLAAIKGSKWTIIIIGIVVMILIYLTIGKLDNLLHPNLDKDMARQHVADKVIINDIVEKNKNLHKVVVLDKKANELTIKASNDFVEKKIIKEDKINTKTNNLVVEQKVLEVNSNVRLLPGANDKRTLVQKILDDSDYQRELEVHAAEININAINAVFKIVKE